jgi:DNA replication and repair protein RecF
MSKSSLSHADGQSVRHGEEFFMLSGDYVADSGRAVSVACAFGKGKGKTLKYCGKEYERLADHIGAVPVVMVSPADGALVSDSADERRRWLNAFISQLDHPYLDNTMRYNRVLAERNTLLKQGEYIIPELLDVLDERLADLGEKVAATRRDVVGRLAPLVEKYYAFIADDHEPVELTYRSDLNERPFLEVLQSVRQKDVVCGFTNSGVHRDDVVMKIGGYPLRKYGSQGQQKSFLVSLKFAQYEIMKQNYGFAPILLLDDVFDKLDMGRISNLLQMVASNDFGQIFITDSNKVRMAGIVDGLTQDRAYFETVSGTFERI